MERPPPDVPNSRPNGVRIVTREKSESREALRLKAGSAYGIRTHGATRVHAFVSMPVLDTNERELRAQAGAAGKTTMTSVRTACLIECTFSFL